jgi:hypothetical protein
VIPSGVPCGTPVAGRLLSALEGVMAKLVTFEALGRLVEAEVPFQSVGGGKGRGASLLSKVLCLGAGSGDGNCGRFLASTFPLRCEPSGLLCKRKSSVEGSGFPANVSEGI